MPEVLVVMQTELGSFDFAAFFASEESCFAQDDRIKGAKKCFARVDRLVASTWRKPHNGRCNHRFGWSMSVDSAEASC